MNAGVDQRGPFTTTWNKVSGSGTVTFGNANAIDTAATFSAGGVYVLRLTANDGELTTQDEVTVTVSLTNQAPQVNAGPDQSVVLPNTAALDGTVTDDGQPSPVTTTWSKISGPGTVTFGNASAIDTTAAFSVEGVYVLRLTANDGEFGVVDEVTVTASLPNVAPQVNAGADQSVVLPNTAVLDGTVADDENQDPSPRLGASSVVPGP